MIIIGLFLLAYYIQFYFYLWILALINMCNLYIMCHCAYMLKKEKHWVYFKYASIIRKRLWGLKNWIIYQTFSLLQFAIYLTDIHWKYVIDSWKSRKMFLHILIFKDYNLIVIKWIPRKSNGIFIEWLLHTIGYYFVFLGYFLVWKTCC